MDFKCSIADLSQDYITGKAKITLFTDRFVLNNINDLLDKELNCKLVRFRKKRSLDANAYFWVLVDKLAASVNAPKEEIYRNYIRNIGGNSISGCYRNQDVDKMCRGWNEKGLGWQTETFESKVSGCTNITFYLGSSEYDTEQMSRLIDLCVQDCKAVGIETATPEEIDKMLRMWGNEV